MFKKKVTREEFLEFRENFVRLSKKLDKLAEALGYVWKYRVEKKEEATVVYDWEKKDKSAYNKAMADSLKIGVLLNDAMFGAPEPTQKPKYTKRKKVAKKK
jgi:hypothetical protein